MSSSNDSPKDGSTKRSAARPDDKAPPPADSGPGADPPDEARPQRTRERTPARGQAAPEAPTSRSSSPPASKDAPESGGRGAHGGRIEPPSESTPSAPSTPSNPPASEERESRPSRGKARQVHRLARWVFYLVWIVGIPLGLAILVVWAFTPARDAGPVGGLPMFIAEQKIPAGILFFTAFAVLLWRFRHDLPLSAMAGVGGRRDVSAKLRARLEDAGALIEEARRILKTRRRDVERELTQAEREDLLQGLEDLERAMESEPFAVPLFEKAHSRAERLIGEHLARWRKGEIREYAESIAIAVGVALLLRAFVVEAFKIPSGSMIPTLLIGDHIFVNKFKYGPMIPFTDTRLFTNLPPARADVIVFKFPEKPEQDFIKRTIAIPGDTLQVVDGRPILNGWLVPHCRVGHFTLDGNESELYLETLNGHSYFTLFRQAPSDTTCETDRDCPHEFDTCYWGVCGRDGKEYHAKQNEVWVLGDNRDNSHDSRAWNGGRGGGVPFDNIKGRALVVFATFGPGGDVTERFFVDVMGRPRLPPSNARLQPALEKCLREAPKDSVPPNPR